MRVFAACNNRELVVVNAGNGEKVTNPSIGRAWMRSATTRSTGSSSPPMAAPKEA